MNLWELSISGKLFGGGEKKKKKMPESLMLLQGLRQGT
jgi:hypothetical protein